MKLNTKDVKKTLQGVFADVLEYADWFLPRDDEMKDLTTFTSDTT